MLYIAPRNRKIFGFADISVDSDRFHMRIKIRITDEHNNHTMTIVNKKQDFLYEKKIFEFPQKHKKRKF